MTRRRKEQLRHLDQQLVAAASKVRVLRAIRWPKDLAAQLEEAFRAGAPFLPKKQQPAPLAAAVVDGLKDVAQQADKADPAQAYLARTAESYLQSASLVAHIGTPHFHRASHALYGGPGGSLAGATLTHLQAADSLLASTEALHVPESRDEAAYDAEAGLAWMKSRLEGVFDSPLSFVADAHMNAKASASSRRVRLRQGAHFTQHELRRLLQHEVYVHVLTARNGRAQPLAALGFGAPRTTATQEGLATFAELVTGAIDLERLRRLALRVKAVHWAEEGADLIELVGALREIGEPLEDAIETALRTYRGGDPKGRHVFTKDTVYLKGLFAVHTFLRKTIARREPARVERLFAGRLTLADVSDLAPCFEDGTLALPKRLPPWAQRLGHLAGFLVVSALIDHIALGEVTLDDIEESVSRDA